MIDRDLWLAAVKEATEAPLPESDALTINEFADMIGLGRSAARSRMLVLLAKGKAAQTTKPIRRCDGRVVDITAYRLIP